MSKPETTSELKLPAPALKILRDALAEANRTGGIYYGLRPQYEKARQDYLMSVEHIITSLLPMMLRDDRELDRDGR